MVFKTLHSCKIPGAFNPDTMKLTGRREVLLRVRLRVKCDGTCTETRFLLSAKRMSSFKWAGAPVQSTTGSRGVRISGSNAGYTMFWYSVKGTHSTRQFPLYFPSRASPCAITFQLDSDTLYFNFSSIEIFPLYFPGIILKIYVEILCSKGKAIQLQAWTGPECSRRLRLPDFKTIGTWRWQGC